MKKKNNLYLIKICINSMSFNKLTVDIKNYFYSNSMLKI